MKISANFATEDIVALTLSKYNKYVKNVPQVKKM